MNPHHYLLSYNTNDLVVSLYIFSLHTHTHAHTLSPLG